MVGFLSGFSLISSLAQLSPIVSIVVSGTVSLGHGSEIAATD